jgi:hypothetical protein
MISKFSTYLFLSKSCLIFSLTIEGDTERAYSETISGAYRYHISAQLSPHTLVILRTRRA